jgi:hypothetical protein
MTNKYKLQILSANFDMNGNISIMIKDVHYYTQKSINIIDLICFYCNQYLYETTTAVIFLEPI